MAEILHIRICSIENECQFRNALMFIFSKYMNILRYVIIFEMQGHKDHTTEMAMK